MKIFSRITDWLFQGYRVFLVPLFFLPLIALPNAWYAYGTTEVRTEVIEHKERVCSGGQNSDCTWMIFTDMGEYTNSDSLFHLKFHSTTLHRELPLGEEATFVTYGWRVPFFSAYPNIVRVVE